jgi:hypothetical protein
MVDVTRQKPMNIPHPHMAETYVARDGSGVCLSLNTPNASCARDSAVKKTRLELVFNRYEVYETR